MKREGPWIQALPPGTRLRRFYRGAWREIVVEYPSHEHYPGAYRHAGVRYRTLRKAVGAITGDPTTDPLVFFRIRRRLDR